MEVVRGELPAWARSSGSGSGYGDGYGDGSGSGSGSGYGYGYGYGDGDDLVACSPAPTPVTAADLKRADACDEAVGLFQCAFPNGGTWPDDIAKAAAAGLDINWCRRLGLLRPIAKETK